MSTDRQELIPRTMGEALAKLVRKRWPHSTAKAVERAWDLDRTTAGNLIKGHASERTITKAVRVEGWELLEALGHALTGMTHDEWVEAKFTAILEEAERAQADAQASIHRIRARRNLLAERTPLAAGEAAAGPPENRPGTERNRPSRSGV